MTKPTLVRISQCQEGDPQGEHFKAGSGHFISRENFFKACKHLINQGIELHTEQLIIRVKDPYALGLHLMSWGEEGLGTTVYLQLYRNNGWGHEQLFGIPIEYVPTMSPGRMDFVKKQGDNLVAYIETDLTNGMIRDAQRTTGVLPDATGVMDAVSSGDGSDDAPASEPEEAS